MYNSELWNINIKKKEKKIDPFQRNLLRKIMNIKWPQIIANEEFMIKAKQKKMVRYYQKEEIVLIRICMHPHNCIKTYQIK